ncbi:hypothetical protein Tco_0983938 [Tanacetum coccineum]
MRRKKVNDEAEANAPPKVLRKDHVSSPAHSAYGGKSLAAMGLGAGSISSTPAAQGAPTAAKSVSDSDPLSYVKPQPYLEQDIAQYSRGTATEIPNEHVATTEVNVQIFVGSLESGKSTFVSSVAGSPGGIYQPGWGVTNDCRLDTPDACQDMMDHIVPSGYFSELRHLPNADFLSQYNINLARQVAMGSQLRLMFEQEAKNLETLLEAEIDMKKAAEAKNTQVTGEERIKATFEEFKKYEDDKVEQRCAEIDDLLNKLRVDFDEKLQAFADVVSAGLAKCMIEGLKYDVEYGKADRDLADIEAYDPEANSKLVKALQDLKDLKYPMMDQLERLKDALMELIMASLHLESDTGEDAPQWIRDLRLSSSKLMILVYLEKRKCKVVCHTHGIGSAHHARSDGIHVSAPTVVTQGLAILLADAATQIEAADKEDELHPRL